MIEYDKKMLSWKLTEPFRNTTAVTNAPLASYALGAHEWLIENDSLECSNQGEPYKKRLKLSGCWEGEFTCNDGQCIRDWISCVINKNKSINQVFNTYKLHCKLIHELCLQNGGEM